MGAMADPLIFPLARLLLPLKASDTAGAQGTRLQGDA